MPRGIPLILLLLVGCTGATVAPAAPPVASFPPPEPAPASLPDPAPTPPPAPPPTPPTVAAATPQEDTCIPRAAKGTRAPPPKQQVAEQLLKGQSVYLFLDTRRAGVVVPAHLAGKSRLVLEVGYSMPTPIPDLKVDRAGISGTLSFRRTPFFTSVPWSAVYAVTGSQDAQGRQWDDDVPEDLRCP